MITRARISLSLSLSSFCSISIDFCQQCIPLRQYIDIDIQMRGSKSSRNPFDVETLKPILIHNFRILFTQQYMYCHEYYYYYCGIRNRIDIIKSNANHRRLFPISIKQLYKIIIIIILHTRLIVSIGDPPSSFIWGRT